MESDFFNLAGDSEMRLILIILIAIVATPALPNSIRVGKKESFQSIAQAIAAAKRGDTIWIEKGIYYEKNLVVNKPIVLKGIGQPILEGEKKYEIITIKADHVTIDGFILRHTGVSSLIDFAAIRISNCRDAAIVNNVIIDAFFGIYSQYGTHCLIRNNTLKGAGQTEQESGNGIHCWKSDSMSIIGNSVNGHRDGIYFEFVTNSVIWRNLSFKNIRYGLHFMFSNDDAYIANVFENNGAGVAVMFSKGIKIFSNYFKENWGDGAYGLLLKEINDSRLDGNHFESNTMAVYAEGANRIDMVKNVFKNNGWALKIQASCTDISLRHNNFLGNTFDVGTNGSLVLNQFDGNYWDKYEGYDLNRDGIGDVPYRPVSLYSMIVERNPSAMVLFRSFMTSLLEKSEKILPTLTPENLKDNAPLMKPLHL